MWDLLWQSAVSYPPNCFREEKLFCFCWTMIDLLLKYMWKTLALQNGRSPLNYKLIRHRFATCIFFHFFSSMLSLYKKMICGSTISHVDCLPNESLVLQNHDKNLFSTKGPFSTKRSVQHHFNLIKWYLTNLL